MNGSCAFGHGFGFLSSDLAVHGVKLSVDIGHTDFIQIDQSQIADTRTRQRFHRPGPHTAHTDDRDPGQKKTLQRRMTIEPRDAAETMRDGIRHARKLSVLQERVTQGMNDESVPFKKYWFTRPDHFEPTTKSVIVFRLTPPPVCS